MKEGFDPRTIADPLYWYDPATSQYEPLSAARHAEIDRGRHCKYLEHVGRGNDIGEAAARRVIDDRDDIFAFAIFVSNVECASDVRGDSPRS